MKVISLYMCMFSEAFDVPIAKVGSILDAMDAAGLAVGMSDEIDPQRAGELLQWIWDDRDGVRAWLLKTRGYPIGRHLRPPGPVSGTGRLGGAWRSRNGNQ